MKKVWVFLTFRPKICNSYEGYLITGENENWGYSSPDLEGKNCSMT